MGLCHAKSLYSEKQLLDTYSFSKGTAVPFLIFVTTAGSQNALFHFFQVLGSCKGHSSGASLGRTSVSF